MLAALLIPLLACPPTSIPTRHQQQGGHFLASPYGVPYDLQATPTAPRSFPTPDVWLPLWDLDATLAEVEALLALDDPPEWAPWLAWVLVRASQRGDGHEHLLAALSSSELSAEQLAWWRSIPFDPAPTLRQALDRSTSNRTRALLTTTLALTEHARSCPVPVDVDGGCRAPGIDSLLRRSAITLERARHWTELAHKRWAKLDLDHEELATRALWAEFQLAVAILDYESLLDVELPAALSFVVEEWRHDSGVPSWEAEYEHQLVRAEESKARVGAWFESTTECARTQLDLHAELLWIDADSTSVVLLRSARMLLAFAEAAEAEYERPKLIFTTRGVRYVYDKKPDQIYVHVGPSQYDAVYEQAQQWLELCLAHESQTLDGSIGDACAATLARLDWGSFSDLRSPIEFTGQARTTSTMQAYVVVESID